MSLRERNAAGVLLQVFNNLLPNVDSYLAHGTSKWVARACNGQEQTFKTHVGSRCLVVCRVSGQEER
jgi:hypothetical protein